MAYANRLLRSPVKPHNEPHDDEEEHEMNIKPIEQRRSHQGRLLYVTFKLGRYAVRAVVVMKNLSAGYHGSFDKWKLP